MTEPQLSISLNNLLTFPTETEVAEFKEAKYSFDFREANKYILVLSNKIYFQKKVYVWSFSYTAPQLGGIIGGIVSNHAELLQHIDIQTLGVYNLIDSDQASVIAGGIAGGIAEKFNKVLAVAKEANSRKDILKNLNMVNNANNFETYIQPLVALNWLSMTIPNKPTSPNQQYFTTLKGRLILEFLKKKY